MLPRVALPRSRLRTRVLLLGLPVLAAGAGAAEPASAAGPEIESFIARATPEHPRHSEGDILVLRDGTLLAAWTEFAGGARDDAPAHIAAACSTDGGRTWGPRTVIQENSGRANVMSVSLLRSRSGDVLFFFLRKNAPTDLKVFVRRSTDDAKTWGPPLLVTPEDGYHVMNNSRVLQLRSGRLVASSALACAWATACSAWPWAAWARWWRARRPRWRACRRS